jgi:protein-ribulosamine 3-kinase
LKGTALEITSSEQESSNTEPGNMAPNVDPAISEALGLGPDVTKIASHGGSGFSSTFKLSSTLNGQAVNYFVKTGAGKDAETMFRGENPSPRVLKSGIGIL